MLVNVAQGLVTFDWADGGDIWQDVHPHNNEEVLMEQCKRVKALGTGATTDRFRAAVDSLITKLPLPVPPQSECLA